jgi:hypothetical protein
MSPAEIVYHLNQALSGLEDIAGRETKEAQRKTLVAARANVASAILATREYSVEEKRSEIRGVPRSERDRLQRIVRELPDSMPNPLPDVAPWTPPRRVGRG